MIIELASLPPMVQTYIQNEQKVQLVVQGEQVHLMPLHQFVSQPTKKSDFAGGLAQFANSDLMPKEEQAVEMAIRKKIWH